MSDTPSEQNDITVQAAENPPRPGHRRRRPSFLLILATLLYALPLLVVLGGNIVGPEDWWLTAFNLYLPQWLWLTPLAVLLPWYALRARTWTLIPLALCALVLLPVMGLRLHFGSSVPSPDKSIHLRVMTYNIKWAKTDVQAIIHDIETSKPDLLLMQDAGAGTLDRELGTYLKGWNVAAIDQYIIASRLPLAGSDIRWISYPDQSHRVLRAVLKVNGTDVAVYSCHLESPRFGLSGMRHPRAGLAQWEANVALRVRESKRLAEYAHAETLPVLLGGDLNAPIQSVVCKNLFEAGLEDAFSNAGSGFGYTYGTTTKVGRPYVRIDHIFTGPNWKTRACWVGNAVGSDHCPVLADVYYSPPAAH